MMRGRKILVTGGTVKNPIDGVHHYASRRHGACLGHRAAALLAAEGAEVFLVSARNGYAAPAGVRVFENALSGEDLLTAVRGIAASEKIDAALHLADVPNFAAEKPGHEKTALKPAGRGEFEFRAVVQRGFHDLLDARTFAGYGRVRKFSRGDEDIVASLWDIASAAETAPELYVPFDITPMETPSLSGRRVIVTAGATAEKISGFGDVIGRHGTTRHGFDIAQALAQAGAEVILISGQTSRTIAHRNIKLIRIDSAFEMLAAVQRSLPADAFVNAAAISGFTTAEPVKKIHRDGELMNIYLHPTPDILEAVGTLPAALRPAYVAGLAAGTGGLIEEARKKLADKNIDALIAMPPNRDAKDAAIITGDRVAVVRPQAVAARIAALLSQKIRKTV